MHILRALNEVSVALTGATLALPTLSFTFCVHHGPFHTTARPSANDFRHLKTTDMGKLSILQHKDSTALLQHKDGAQSKLTVQAIAQAIVQAMVQAAVQRHSPRHT